MRLLFVFNPNAAFGRAKENLPEILQAFEQNGISVVLKKTEAPGHAKEIAAQTDLSQYDGIVAGGGDGTLFEVVNGYYLNPQRGTIPMGVVPVGTGNAFARELDLLATEWQKAVEIIARKQIKKIDVGHFVTGEEKYYFVNILGLGFVSDVSKTAQKYKRFGNSAYTFGVFEELIFLKTHRLEMILDDQTIERENIFVEISNTRYTGTSFLMAPEAKIDDGMLDITLLNKKSRFGILKIFPTIFNGSHVQQPGVETFKARSIKIKTDRPKVLTPDGEILGSTPIEVTCRKQDLPFFWL
ncbi:MAG TPA: diacylglycerol kinase family lipid kinase [Caldithrix abyssi]|uniref:Diacylglycerol kinase family lipid kinase n=1 Tax=Caldithrix abyssi TaxID=187145 RepID=A0A7V5UG04_CALAY|nr:diacylglycerol kinase family lipid kinase [Caldithrix abyssi]